MTDENIELTKEDVNKILMESNPIGLCIRNTLEHVHTILNDSTQSTKIDGLDLELIQKDADLISRRISFILQARYG
jgi:hypothetical protein